MAECASNEAKRRAKLDQLIEVEGFESEEALFAAALADSVCMAICVNEGCDYTAEMEPDQREGWCEVCGTNTVASALVLGGII
jgi:hypothetical protein